MSFNYKWTCPDIDKIYTSLYIEIKKFVKVEDEDEVDTIISNHMDKFRDINSKMRDEAEIQIDNIINDLESQLEDSKNEYNSLEKDFVKLEEEYNSLEKDFVKLEEEYNSLEKDFVKDFVKLEEEYNSLEKDFVKFEEEYNSLNKYIAELK